MRRGSILVLGLWNVLITVSMQNLRPVKSFGFGPRSDTLFKNLYPIIRSDVDDDFQALAMGPGGVTDEVGDFAHLI